MPAICLRRTDIPDGVLQVLDLWPNVSQRNSVTDPVGQTKYLRQPQNDTVAVAANVTSAEYAGVAAWLIDTIEDTGDGGALTAAQANTIAAALLVAMRAGAASTSVTVNVIIAATVAASGIGAGASVGTLAELLQIFAGGQYVVPAGTDADAGAGNYKGSADGAFVAGTFRATYTSGPFLSSVAEGYLDALSSATYEYGGTTGAAVVVYDDSGNVL